MNWAQLMEERQRAAHEREQRALEWAREVSARLAAERSAFLKDFDDNERRIFGVEQ